jgi:DNA-binding XRE family transcriptional regulator
MPPSFVMQSPISKRLWYESFVTVNFRRPVFNKEPRPLLNGMGSFGNKMYCGRSPTYYGFAMKAKTIRDVAALARKRRRELDWAQSQLAASVGVGREWIIDFEKGKSTVEWGLVFRTLKELGLEIDLSESRQVVTSTVEDDLTTILERGRRRP